MNRARSIAPTLLLIVTACTPWHHGLGQIDLPADEVSASSLQRVRLEDHSKSKPRSIDDGMKEIRDRKPSEEGKPPAVVQQLSKNLEAMSVSQLRSLVLENNLDLDVALLTPEIAKQRISAEEGRFDTLIGSRFRFQTKETPKIDGPLVSLDSGNPALDGQVTKLTELEQRQDKVDVGLGVTVPLPTGTRISVESLLSQKSIVDPQQFDQFLGATKFSISQPLLRNAGTDVNLAAIRMARVDHRAAQVTTKLAALRILASAEKAYWRLYAARRLLDVRSEQYRLASRGLRVVQQRFGEGLSPKVDITRARVGVYQRLEALVIAETDWRLRQRDLKRFLATDRFPLRGDRMIEVSTQPKLAGLQLDRDALVRNALRERPELIRIELGLIRDGLRITMQKNRVLPIANLDFSYGTLGRDDALGSAFGSQWSFDNSDISAGISFQAPLTNQRPRALLQQAMLLRSQRLASQRARELQVRQEVLNMADIIDRNWQRILAARQNVLVAGVNYEAEQQQFEAGMRTMREVLEALTDLGNAQLREVRAIVDYQVSQIDLAFATGTLLGYARVALEPLKLPKVQQ